MTGTGIRIAYITMRFPKASEAFAGVDIRALRRLGARVGVYAMRAGSASDLRALATGGLADVPRSVGGWRTIRALWLAVARPRVAWTLATFIIRHAWRRPRHLIAAIAFAPRALVIFDELDRDRPDAVHLFWGHWPALVGALVARFLPETALTTFLGAYDLATGFAGSAAVSARSDAVFTHARCNLAALAALGVRADLVRVIHRGIDLEALPSPDAERIAGRVVTAGRLIAGKGMDDVLRAFAAARAEHPAATLVVLGDGPERDRLERLAHGLGAGSAVRFAGHVAHAEVFAEFARAEAFVLLSRLAASERLPNVVKEAIACGCACVASATPGIDELLPDGRGGVVVPMGRPAAAGEALSALLADGARRRALVESGRDHVRRGFDAALSMREYLATWTAASAMRRPPRTRSEPA